LLLQTTFPDAQIVQLASATRRPCAPRRRVSTGPASGDKGPCGVAIVTQDFAPGGVLNPGDVLVSNFNQGTGSTVMRFTPQGGKSVFFQGQPGLGLTSALGTLKSGFVIVGNLPVVNGAPQTGSLLFLDNNGNLVMTLTDSALLDSSWGLAVNDQGAEVPLFVSNALTGAVTRIDLDVPAGGTPVIESLTRIVSGYAHRTGSNGLIVGPAGGWRSTPAGTSSTWPPRGTTRSSRSRTPGAPTPATAWGKWPSPTAPTCTGRWGCCWPPTAA
jgi:hypothetical protein